jgi:hypothetical protein
MATGTHLDRRARKDLRRAKKMHGGQVPDHIREAAEQAAVERAQRKQIRRERRADATSYFFDRERLARLAPTYAITGVLGSSGVVHAAHANPFIGAAITTAAGGTIWVAKHRSVDTPAKRIYATAVIGYAGVWSTAVATGIGWNGAGNAAFLAGAAILSAPWVYKHLWRWQPTPVIHVEDEPGETLSWFREAWEQYKPVPAEMENEREIPNGRQAELVVARGKQSVEDILNAARYIRSTYDPRPVVVEPITSRRAILTVLEHDVFEEGPIWTGPTLDPNTGIVVIGKYADGQTAHGQFWAPRSGTSDFFIAGTKGSGKSDFLGKLASELHLSPFAVSWVSDPQEGQCLPDFIETIDRYAIGGQDSIEQNMKLLRALRRVVFRRSRYFGREIEWVDAKGRERKGGKRYFDPTETDVHGLRIPALYAFLDEMHALVKHERYGAEALRLLADIVRLSRKTGVGLAYVTHAPSQNEMGGHNASIIRNLLREGTIIAFRTGEPVAQRMLGLSEDPSKLPERFANGKKTYGLGLVGGGPDGRHSRFRAEWNEDLYAIGSQAPAGRLDAMSAEAADQPDDPELAPKTFVVPGVPRPAVPMIPTNAEKQTWADRVLPIFADGREYTQGAVVKAFPPEVSDRSIRWGLKKLVNDGLLHTDGDKKPYRITDAGRARLEQLRDTANVA